MGCLGSLSELAGGLGWLAGPHSGLAKGRLAELHNGWVVGHLSSIALVQKIKNLPYCREGGLENHPPCIKANSNSIVGGLGW